MLKSKSMAILVGSPTGLADCVRKFNPDGDVCPETVTAEVTALHRRVAPFGKIVQVDVAGDGFYKQDPLTPIYGANGTGRPRVMLNNMGVKSRRHEPEAHLDALRSLFADEDILRMPDGATGEGGDVIIVWLRDRHCWAYFVGKPENAPGRTNQAGRDALRAAVEENGNLFFEVPFDASVGKGALHLSTCCGNAGPNRHGVTHIVAARNQLLDSAAFERCGLKVCWAPEGEEWGTNVLRLPVDGAPLCVQQDFGGVLRLLAECGYDSSDICPLNWRQVRLLDGSLTCPLGILQVPVERV